MTHNAQKSEATWRKLYGPPVAGGQGRSEDDVKNASVAVTFTLIGLALLGILLCLR